MKDVLVLPNIMTAEQRDSIGKTVKKERKRLFDFIRKRVSRNEDAEDILQDVFYQFSANYDLIESIEKAASWLFTTAGNKIIDWYRKKRPQSIEDYVISKGSDEDGDKGFLFDLLSSSNVETPEDEFTNTMILETVEAALSELPEEQRFVFEMHELEGMSFKELSQLTGASVNTLLSRKRYAVLHLRERLKDIYDDYINN